MGYNENIIDLPDLDQKIYRVFSMTRALDLFEKDRNALVHPSMWDDPFENFFLNARCFDKDANQEIDLSRIKRSWYGQCWTTLPDTDAMWRIYSPNKDGVCVATTVRKLFNSIFCHDDKMSSLKCFIGKVKYVPETKVADFAKTFAFTDLAFGACNIKFAASLLIKRIEFEHEHEVRLLFHDADEEFVGKSVMTYKFDALSIIDNIMFDPRLDHRIMTSYSMAFQALGAKCNIEQSKLYTAPVLWINL